MQFLYNLSFEQALDLALGESGVTREYVGEQMGWGTSHTSRIFNQNENYFPTLPSIPKLCTILGNDLILDWLTVHTQELRKGRHDKPPVLNELDILKLLNTIGKEVGDVNAAVEKALEDDVIDSREAKKIIKEAYDVLARYHDLITAVRPIQSAKAKGAA